MPDMMGDTVGENHAHQDPLDLRMTVKDCGSQGARDLAYPRDSTSRLSGGSCDSSRSPPHTQTPGGGLYPVDKVLTPGGGLYPVDKILTSRSPSATVTADLGAIEEQAKEFEDSLDASKNGADRIGAPLRPFKMYPHVPMDPSMYGSMLGGAVGSMGSPGGMGSLGLSSLYDSPPTVSSPGSSPFGLGVAPMVSYVMQKRRRHEAREKENKDRDISSSRSPPSTVTATTTSTSTSGSGSLSLSDGADEPDDKKLKLVPDEKKDDAYWERRRKNNEAAKRSRDARRQKEEEIAMRAAFLEQENLKLRAQVAILKNETAKLHYLLYNRV